MANYTHRERVQMAFSHQEPDRVPLDMMGNATMLLDGTYVRLRDYLGLSPIRPVRSGSSANYYDERILETFDIDFRRVFLPKRPQAKAVTHADGTFSDMWGVRYQKAGIYVNALDHPLQGAETVADVEAYDWPKADDMFTVSGMAELARGKQQNTDYAIVARNPLSEGFLDRSSQLMGMAEFMMTLALAPDVAHSIITHLLKIYKNVYAMFLGAIGPYVQMVEVGDDLGTQNSLLISPTMYREFIKPAEKELYALIHEKARGAALFRHTDGAIFDIIPDLVEVGVDVLNPVQTSTKGMEATRLKNTYGEAITFHGAIEVMEGDVSAEQVATEVRQKIDALAPDGGYVLASCNHMIDVKPENILALFETARQYGRYH